MYGRMSRKHRRPSYSSFADDDTRRDLVVFASSLVMGVCLGVFAFYFFAYRPSGQQLAQLKADLASATARAQSCTTAGTNRAGLREELESRLSSCTADLARLRRATQAAAQNGVAPPLPKPPPGRAAETPVEPASVIPAENAAETGPVAEIVPPVEPVPPVANEAGNEAAGESVALAGQPPLPKPPPSARRGSWPANFPPQPKPHPPRPSGTAPTVETFDSPAPTKASDGPSQPLQGAETVTLDVGEEEDVGGYKLRLIAVSRRSTASYCIIGGNGMIGQSLASGTSKRVNWNGHSVTLQATVRDGDTCQVALRPG